ncbi:unnamed protein product [Sphagnum jensenii]|uniref:Uncharacterized protein n=1 Tax=Sphagnum jensenii TaxID=128206 RepID=A0ABP0WRI3_9BRYO
MAACTVWWDVQGCRSSCCSSVSLVSIPGSRSSSSSNEFSAAASSSSSSVQYACHKALLGSSTQLLVTGDLQESFRKVVKLQFKGGGQQQQQKTRDSRKLEMRALYSPLVESFKSVDRKSQQFLKTASDSAIQSSSSSVASRADTSFVMVQTTITPTPNDDDEEEGDDGRQDQSSSADQLSDEKKDDVAPTPQDPVAAASGDHHASAANLSDLGFNVYAKRSARARPPSMSISQSFTAVGGQAFTRTIGAVGGPLTNASRIRGAGPLGVVTAAVTVAVLGLTTAALRNGLRPSTPQKVCTKCDGYGVQQCHVCEGQGKLIWEGKLRRMDPCPLCFGSCLEKCRRCGGIKMKRGIPPNLRTQTSQNVKKS